MLQRLSNLALDGRLAALAQMPVAATLSLRSILTNLDQAVAQPHAHTPTDLATLLPATLERILGELASRRQVCQEVLPLMKQWAARESAVCTAVMQPAVVVAALRHAGLAAYIGQLHPAIMEHAISGVGTEGQHAAAAPEMGMQVCL